MGKHDERVTKIRARAGSRRSALDPVCSLTDCDEDATTLIAQLNASGGKMLTWRCDGHVSRWDQIVYRSTRRRDRRRTARLSWVRSALRVGAERSR